MGLSFLSIQTLGSLVAQLVTVLQEMAAADPWVHYVDCGPPFVLQTKTGFALHSVRMHSGSRLLKRQTDNRLDACHAFCGSASCCISFGIAGFLFELCAKECRALPRLDALAGLYAGFSKLLPGIYNLPTEFRS